MIRHVCLLGFGEVGQALAPELRTRVERVSAWDLKFADGGGAQTRAATRLGVFSPDAAGAVARADLVISAVTAAQIGAAATSVASHLARGAWWFDLNSCSPTAKAAASDIVSAAGGRFVEAAVMSPIAPLAAASPMLIGGSHAAQFQPLARQLGFTATRVLPGKVGTASAAKMCRSVLVKGMEALLAESLLAARRHGVDEAVLASMRDVLPATDWRAVARYMISRSLQHGARRAEEMREVARTLSEAGIEPSMSLACVDRQDWAAQHGEAAGAGSLEAMLDAILAAENERTR
jgi:3-hydroxyisobutyrate dehydrogenase-like beta-hydroxyacid dehydrogenase